MDNIQKFLSDAEKIKKHYRAEHPGKYSGTAVCEQICNLFIRNNRTYEQLAAAFAQYWMDTYILGSADQESLPTSENLDTLAAMQSLLDNDSQQINALSDKDLKELCQIVNMEAEDIPIDVLNSLMMIFVDRQVF